MKEKQCGKGLYHRCIGVPILEVGCSVNWSQQADNRFFSMSKIIWYSDSAEVHH